MTQLAISRFKQAEYERTVYSVVPEHGTPFDAVTEPDYWAHVSARMRPGDRIEVQAEDGSYWAELLVRDAGRLFAKVSVLRKVDLDEETVTGELPVSSDMTIKWRGPHLKWCVLRGNDAIKEHCQTKGEAGSWLSDHIKALAK